MAAVDTIGGIRIPAAFCGIFGYRASHGVISTVGVIPVAPSLDVVGKNLNHEVQLNKSLAFIDAFLLRTFT